MIPIVINNRNRLTTLKLLLESLPTTKIIILDNDSTYEPLLMFYQDLPENVELVKLGKNCGNYAVINWGGYKDFDSQYFVYTDPDIVLAENCPRDCLEYLVKVKEKYPQYNKVGLSLKIDDIPDHYPFKKNVLKLESMYWNKSIDDKELGTLWISEVDTTFALYDKDKVQASYGNCLRTDIPYCARHLPWYIDKKNLSYEEIYYTMNCTAKNGDHAIGYWTKNHRQFLNDFNRMI